MIVGLVAAAANGTGMPLMIILFGEMTNSFVLSGIQSNGKKFKLNFYTYRLAFLLRQRFFFPPDYTLVHYLRKYIMSVTHPAGNNPVISIHF